MLERGPPTEGLALRGGVGRIRPSVRRYRSGNGDNKRRPPALRHGIGCRTLTNGKFSSLSSVFRY